MLTTESVGRDSSARHNEVVSIDVIAPGQSVLQHRREDEKRARRLAWAGNAWHLVEFAVAIGAGIAAGSVALIGFGADSLIELFSGSVIVWLFNGGRGGSETAESRARRLIAASYFVVAAYIVGESMRDIIQGHHPQPSWVGIALAAITAATMPVLAEAKRRVGARLGSAATTSEAGQNQLCAYLSIALLVGLLANALVGWWWADPVAALVIAAIAIREGRDTWRGEACSCC